MSKSLVELKEELEQLEYEYENNSNGGIDYSYMAERITFLKKENQTL